MTTRAIRVFHAARTQPRRSDNQPARINCVDPARRSSPTIHFALYCRRLATCVPFPATLGGPLSTGSTTPRATRISARRCPSRSSVMCSSLLALRFLLKTVTRHRTLQRAIHGALYSTPPFLLQIKAELYDGNAIVLFAYGLSGSGKTFTVFGMDAVDNPVSW